MPTRANGDAIRRIREERGLSIPQLADAADLDRAYVYRIERGDRFGSAGTRLKIANALGVPLADITRQVDRLRRDKVQAA